MINWKDTLWNKETVTNVHGDIYLYRDIHKGKHAEHFERAKALIEKGEITDPSKYDELGSPIVKTPYIVMNIAKLVAETPAMLVARSIGKVTSSLSNDEQVNELADQQGEETIDAPTDSKSDEVDDLQNEIIRQIEKNSRLALEHKPNLVQHQVDGGLVGVPRQDAKGLRIEFKSRDVYFPHEDEMGADLAYKRTIDGKDYLHVYRERVDGDNLTATNMLFTINGGKLEEVEPELAKKILGMNQLVTQYPGRSQLFIQYLANDKTFMDPYGVPCFEGLLGHQDEINWRLTRNALVFERNSTPRMAVTSEIFAALQDHAEEKFGEAGRHFIDHEVLEVVTMDENGKSMEIIQVDVKNIGGVEWAEKLIREVLIATRTSQKAIDFFSDDASNNAVSGVAKFYDLFVSIVKAEQLQQEYVYFLKQLFEACLWLENNDNKLVQVEEPDIALNEMVPVTRTDLVTENLPALEAGGMSLETFVRRTNPGASEEWIMTEIERIEMEKVSVDSTGTPSSETLNDNRDANGELIEDDETTVVDEE